MAFFYPFPFPSIRRLQIPVQVKRTQHLGLDSSTTVGIRSDLENEPTDRSIFVFILRVIWGDHHE